MEQTKLINQVVEEVLKRMKGQKRVLVLFTGGAIGLEEALEELKTVQQLAVEMTVVLSGSAEKVIGINRLRQKLGQQVKILTTLSPYPGQILRAADVVLVPVLTMNSAAKVASLLADTPVSTLIIQALLLGKPVLAAKNGADPDDIARASKSMNKGNRALNEALRANLRQLKTFGVLLLPVEQLATETQKVLNSETKTEARGLTGKRQVLDAESVKAMVGDGMDTIHVAKGTVVTPLARDTAERLNAVIIRDI